ncbi:unnamed protein product [Mycena citricolor]|uniref:Peroxisomal membrane protein PEX16 n=1 Tax=Mycena citricolor TaxID=2018698 RepID=A0AAD2Q622_9AGAR|nr:unnamed protein product [Mycena citricolor]
MAAYEDALVHHLPAISTLESSLRSLTWFLPGRFKDAELASEALAASLNLVSMYHDTLLGKIVQKNPKYRPLIPTSLHTRFTRAWSDKNTQYRWIARTLEFIRFTELVVEMTLRRKVSERARWRIVVLIESIKALLRIVLLRITRRPLLSPPIPERDFDPAALPAEPDTAASPHVAPSVAETQSPPATPAHLKNNRIPLPPHPLLVSSSEPSDTPAEDYLLSKALTASSVKPSHALLKTLASHRDWLAEYVYILRPLVYVSLLVTDKKQSSRPLVVALVMELIARNLRRSPPPSASLERAEYARRDRDIVWYLLRGSIWETYTRPKLESFATATSQRPLLGLVGALVKDWIPLIDEYYYYTAP